jgi:hypothetical protein
MHLYAIIAVVWLASLAGTNLYTAHRYEAIGVALEKQNTAELINTARKATDKLLTDERTQAARTGAVFETKRQTVQQVFTQLDNEARYEALIAQQANQHTAPVDAGDCELPASRLRRWNDANRGVSAAAPAPAPSEPAPAAAPAATFNERRSGGAGGQPQASGAAVPRTGGTGLRAIGLPSLTLPNAAPNTPSNATFKYGTNSNNRPANDPKPE